MSSFDFLNPGRQRLAAKRSRRNSMATLRASRRGSRRTVRGSDLTGSTAVNNLSTATPQVPAFTVQATPNSYAYMPTDLNNPIESIMAAMAMALVHFNVYGVPLAFGMNIEYYWTMLLASTSLVKISSVLAVQLFFIFASTIPVALVYQAISNTRAVFIVGCVGVAVSHLLPMACKAWWHFLLVQGVGMGLSLGTISTVGSLHYFTHHANNVTQSSFTGRGYAAIGALVYTLIASLAFASLNFKIACGLNFVVSALTLSFSAYFLTPLPEKTKWHCQAITFKYVRTMLTGTGATWMLYIPAYLCISFALFNFPAFFPLYYAQFEFPISAARILMAGFGVTLILTMALALWIAGPSPRFGSLNGLVLASIVGGLMYFPIATSTIIPPNWILWVSTIHYLLSAGIIIFLFVGAMKPLLGAEKIAMLVEPGRVAFMLTLCGFAAAAGVLVTGHLIEKQDFATAFMINGCALIAGGMLLLCARCVKVRPDYMMVI